MVGVARRVAPEGFKWCPDCEQFKTLAEFRVCRNHKDGLATYCKPCQVARNHRRQLEKEEAKPKPLPPDTPRCAACECFLPASEDMLLPASDPGAGLCADCRGGSAQRIARMRFIVEGVWPEQS